MRQRGSTIFALFGWTVSPYQGAVSHFHKNLQIMNFLNNYILHIL